MTRRSELNDYSKLRIVEHVEKCLVRHLNVREDEFNWAPRTAEESHRMSDSLIESAVTVLVYSTGLYGNELSDIDFYKLIPRYVKDLDFRAKVNELVALDPAPNQKLRPVKVP